MKKTEDTKKPTKPTLKEIYNEEKITNPLQLAAKAGVSVAYAKRFLKSNVEELDVVSSKKIDLKNVNYSPAGSSDNYHWQADIMFLHDYKRLKANGNHIGVLTLLNTTTRVANARALKSTKATEVSNKMLEMINEIGRINFATIRTDAEFTNKEFQKMLEDQGIESEIAEPYTHNWLARTNRFHRTLKESMKNLFTINGNKIWYPHLKSLIDDYNNTPSYAFRDNIGFKHEAKTVKGKLQYSPITPNFVSKLDPEQTAKIHEHEREKARLVNKFDGFKLAVGDHVRLLNALTKEQIKLNGKFAKKSLENSWSTRVYKIIERVGPNFWRIDKPGSEIKQWATYMLKKVSKEAYDNQDQAVKTHETQVKKIQISKAKKEMELEIPVAEKAPVIANRTRQTRKSSRVKGNQPATAETPVENLSDKQKIEFKPDHKKGGKSGERWAIYSKAKTVGELKKLNPEKFKADYKHDLAKGLMWLS